MAQYFSVVPLNHYRSGLCNCVFCDMMLHLLCHYRSGTESFSLVDSDDIKTCQECFILNFLSCTSGLSRLQKIYLKLIGAESRLTSKIKLKQKKSGKVETISSSACCVKVYRKFTKVTAGPISVYGRSCFKFK